jgi:hypothetical protein
MKLTLRLVLLAAFIGLGGWLWTVLFPGPETIIRKHLAKVAALVSFPSQEGQLARIANVQQLGGYFAPDVEISVDTPGHPRQTFSGRDELTQAALGARAALPGLQVKFVDLNIQLAPDRTSATVDLTGEARLAGDRDFFVQELKFYFRKSDGQWLIVRVETVRTLT